MIVGELSARVVNPSCELQVATHPIGLESRTEYVKKLLDLNKKNSVGMVGIWGPGGIGKTTIAKAVFNSMHLKFEGSCFLADVRSNSNDLARMQETLLSIVKDSTLKVSGVNQGVSFIKTRMRHKKVLIILDDVSHSSQLEKLVPSPDCFGPGSRILITTRDKRVLTAHRVDEVHEVKMLDDSQALNLFSLNAFETNKPPSDYVKLAQRAVGYAQGLPLALIVLGRHLFRRSKEEWEATLDSCRGEDPHRQIRDVLKISYDALGADLKGYFLDVACFFKGKLVDDVKPILDACYDLKSVIGIAQLQEKALIRINEVWLGRTKRDVIWMHDLIEEMGKDIVYQESPDEPGDRTRVWSRDDAEHVLTNNTGTNKVVGIQGHPRNRIPLNPKSFLEMKMLRYVSMTWTSYDYSEEFNYLSNQLRWLDWPYIPFRNFPSNFPANKLVQFNIPYSRRITRLWERRQNLSSLTRMDLRGCIFLRELPDFGGTPNLNELDLSECSGLVKVPDSLCLLDKLVTLKADRCYSLVKFPRKINLKSIETISISYCKLEEFSEVGEEMVSLRSLDLSWCENLKTLPCSIYGLQNLEVLILDECSKLVRFPPSNTNILNNDGLSPSLPKLRSFSIKGCSLSDCDFLMTLDCWETLEALYLSRNNFVSLPACLSKCVKLRYLELNGCKRLRGIPELPPNVRPEIEGCESLDSGLRLKAEEPSTVIPSKRQRCRDQ